MTVPGMACLSSRYTVADAWEWLSLGDKLKDSTSPMRTPFGGRSVAGRSQLPPREDWYILEAMGPSSLAISNEVVPAPIRRTFYDR